MTGNEFIDNLLSQSISHDCIIYKGTIIEIELFHNFCNVIGIRNMYVKYDYLYEHTELCFDIAADINEDIEYNIGSNYIRVDVDTGYSEIIITDMRSDGSIYKRYLYEYNQFTLSEFLTKTRSTLEMLDLESPDVFEDYARIMNSHKIKRCKT